MQDANKARLIAQLMDLVAKQLLRSVEVGSAGFFSHKSAETAAKLLATSAA